MSEDVCVGVREIDEEKARIQREREVVARGRERTWQGTESMRPIVSLFDGILSPVSSLYCSWMMK